MLMFRVGTSVTTGKENQVVYGGVHIKTKRDGGAAVHGWPDPTYFERLAGECYAQGITLATDRGCDQGGVHVFGSDRP